MFKVECYIRSGGSTNSIGILWTRNCVTTHEVLIRCISYVSLAQVVMCSRLL